MYLFIYFMTFMKQSFAKLHQNHVQAELDEHHHRQKQKKLVPAGKHFDTEHLGIKIIKTSIPNT